MKKILFGRQAERKAKKEKEADCYSINSIVLGNFYRETDSTIEFKLPNDRKGICYKEYIKEELEGIKEGKEKINFIREFKGDLYVELMVLGMRDKNYECTFFTQKDLKVQSFVTGLIKRKEEVGYSVEIGQSKKIAILQTDKEYVSGELRVFQVVNVSSSLYKLSDSIDREIYIGEKNEITPGAIVRATIIGRPKYIVGEKRIFYSRSHYMYTSDAMGICTPIIESDKEYEVDEQVDVIIIYVSMDRSIVRAVPYAEYEDKIKMKIPDRSLIGMKCSAKVVLIEDWISVVSMNINNTTLKGILQPIHYSDYSTTNTKPSFTVDSFVDVKIFNIEGYKVILTSKESLINDDSYVGNKGIKEGSIVVSVAVSSTHNSVVCKTFGGACILIKKFENDGFYIGKVYKVKIKKDTGKNNVYFGKRVTDGEKESEDKENISESNRNKKSSMSGKSRKSTRNKENKEKKEKYKKRKYLIMNNNKTLKDFKNGEVVDCIIEGVYQYGAFASISKTVTARIKISEISTRFVQDWQSLVYEGQRTKIVIYDIDLEKNELEGSIKKYEALQSSLSQPQSIKEKEVISSVNTSESPLVYAEEDVQEEESSEYESNESEQFQMEIFNSKESPDPWIKRISTLTPGKALSLWKKALDTLNSIETKKAITLHLLFTLSNYPDEQSAGKYIPEVLEAIVKRYDMTVLKNALNTCRTSSNTTVYYMICKRFIEEKKESPFGYKELIQYAELHNISVLEEVLSLITHSHLKAADKKEVELRYTETLYRKSKDQGRTLMEKKISSEETKGKSEWIIKYIDLEQNTIQRKSDIAYLRNILDKFLAPKSLPNSTAKNLFKSYLKLEKEYGTKESEERVIAMAKDYVSSQIL